MSTFTASPTATCRPVFTTFLNPDSVDVTEYGPTLR